MGQEEPNAQDQEGHREGIHCRKKRHRDCELEQDSVPESPTPKLVRVDSPESDLFHSGVCSPEAKRIQDDLLSSILDGPEEAAVRGLDSVMRSFEEEILVGAPAPVPDLSPDIGLLVPELGFLLEASDDELGLPPTVFPGSEAAAVGGGFGFVGDIPNYDSFEFGLIGESGVNGGDEFVALGGLFDHSDDSFGTAADMSLSAL